jgi:hypothetical protein
LLGVVLISLASYVQLQTAPRYWRPDARSAANVLRSELRSDDLVFVVGTMHPIQRYYWTEFTEQGTFAHHAVEWRVGPGDEEEARKALEAIRSARRTYVLFYEHHFYDPEGQWEEFLEQRFPIAKAWEFPGTRIWRLGTESVS